MSSSGRLLPMLQIFQAPHWYRVGPGTRPRWIGFWRMIDQPPDCLRDVFDAGEIPLHVFVVEQPDRLSFESGFRKDEHRYVQKTLDACPSIIKVNKKLRLPQV